VALQIDTQPWVNNRNTSITKRMALSIPDGRASPYTLVLDIAAPHLSIQGTGDTLVEVVGNLEGIGWVGFREKGTRRLLADVQTARKSFSGTIGYEYLVTYHGEALPGGLDVGQQSP